MDKRNKPALIARPLGLCLHIVTMTTNDVTSRYVHRRDVNDADDADWLTTATDALPTDDAGCRLYSLVISSGLIGCLIVFGLVGNSTAFLVFQRDTLKTSTSFLFQASCTHHTTSELPQNWHCRFHKITVT